MAFTEGFVSDLVGRHATIDDLPIGKVADLSSANPTPSSRKSTGL